jgi:hypothetical protein
MDFISYANKTAAQREAIEKLIDEMGLHNFLSETAIVCCEKAEHIRSNWQDKSLAKAWERFGTRIGRLYDAARKLS